MDNFGSLWTSPVGGIVVALGVGMLIGVERERSKGTGPSRGAAGVRTFALVSLLGALAGTLGSLTLQAVLGGGIVLLAAVAYLRVSGGDDPGVTTEVALVVAYVLGVLALRSPKLAAGLGVLVALLLASRSWLHDLILRRLSDQEVLDGILLAAAALIVLPVLPDRAVDAYGVVNPQLIWRLTVLVLLLNAFGYLALRALGANSGLAVAGFFGGFVSSAATIGALGGRGRADSALLRPAIAGATLSSVATVVQLALVLAVANPALLLRLAPGLLLMGAVAGAYGGLYTVAAARGGTRSEPLPGRAFQPRYALVFAGTVTCILFVAAWLAERYGAGGATIGIALSGFADAHSASASAASLRATGTLAEPAAVLAVLLAVGANTATKAVIAWTTGGWPYARAIWPGLVLMQAAFAAGAWLTRSAS
jgi:uncharacterized membrane protein (DUF4010 family)